MQWKKKTLRNFVQRIIYGRTISIIANFAYNHGLRIATHQISTFAVKIFTAQMCFEFVETFIKNLNIFTTIEPQTTVCCA